MVKVCDQNWHGKRDKVGNLTLLDTGAKARKFQALDVDNVT
jgi:hypothetical protein